MDEELSDFLGEHENDDRAVGEFIRACNMVAEMAEVMGREELMKSDQMRYLVDYFKPMEDE